MNIDYKDLFSNNNGIMRTGDLIKNGIYYKKIQQLVDEGVIQKIGRGLYQYCDENLYAEIPVITTLYPNGIICRENALFYYGYINRTPNNWHIAVESKAARIRSKNTLNIKLHFMDENKLHVGETNSLIDGFKVKIYNRERTICDCLSNRNKMDSEEFNDAIKNYLNDDEKNIPRLFDYAKKLKVEKKVHEVISIWL